MNLVHKVALDVNNVHAGYLAQACGAARFACNWVPSRWAEMYQASTELTRHVSPCLSRRELILSKPGLACQVECSTGSVLSRMGPAFCVCAHPATTAQLQGAAQVDPLLTLHRLWRLYLPL